MKRQLFRAFSVFCVALVLGVGGVLAGAGPPRQLSLAAITTPGLTTIAYEGMPAPIGGVFQADDAYFRAFYVPGINDAGDIVFVGHVLEDGNSVYGIFRYDAGAKDLQRIQAMGDPTPYGTIFTSTGLPQQNNTGIVVFGAFFRTPPTSDYPNGREASGLFLSLDGNMQPVVTSEDAFFTKGALDGYFAGAFATVDINDDGDLILRMNVDYYEHGPDKGPGRSAIMESESGVYLLPAGKTWQKVLLVGDAAPGGGYIKEIEPRDEIGAVGVVMSDRPVINALTADGAYIVLTARISDAPGGLFTTEAIIRINLDGSLSRVVSWGDQLSGVSGGQSLTVNSFSLVGLNRHGQVGAIVGGGPPDGKHLYVFSSNNSAHRVMGWGDPAHASGSDDTMFETSAGIMAAMNDNLVPVGDPVTGYDAEAVFISPVLDQMTGSYSQDIYSYTSDGALRPVAFSGDVAPDPPGGILYPVESGFFTLARLALNNYEELVAEGFVKLDTGEKRNVIFLTSLDSDGDGLLDTWERDGIDGNGDGTVDVTIAGLDPRHKDILVEIDYMADATHSHRPDARAVSDVIDAFRNAPVDNPDGTTGINLHVFIDEELPVYRLRMWADFDTIKAGHFGSAVDRTDPEAVKALCLVFRYVIFGHQYEYLDGAGNWRSTTSSGYAELPGNDFVVTLGGFASNPGTREEQAGTFMHELGHTLDLRHGGADDVNAKPNYLSIMSYTRQFPRFIPDRPLDYSRQQLPDLDESSLNEGLGIGGTATDKTVYFVDSNGDGYNDSYNVRTGNVPVDWNLDRDTDDSGIRQEINSLVWRLDAAGNPVWRYTDPDPSDPPPYAPRIRVLRGHNDWAGLRYNFRQTAGFDDGEHPQATATEMTWELDNSIQELIAQNSRALTLAVSGSGTIDPAAGVYTYDVGTVVNITAVPAAGWQFAGWTGDVTGVADVNSAATTVTMGSHYSLTAGFLRIPVAGDANDDGRVDSLDITSVERIIAGLESRTAGADANGDGDVNAMDITGVEMIVAGLSP